MSKKVSRREFLDLKRSFLEHLGDWDSTIEIIDKNTQESVDDVFKLEEKVSELEEDLDDAHEEIDALKARLDRIGVPYQYASSSSSPFWLSAERATESLKVVKDVMEFGQQVVGNKFFQTERKINDEG